MAYKMKKLQIPWLKKRVVSLQVPIAICLVLFGIVPMFLCTQTILSSVKQNQIDEPVSYTHLTLPTNSRV